MKVTIHLQNLQSDGCVWNVKSALEMLDGVRAVRVNREELRAEVLYDAPATPLAMREQLFLGGYLSERQEPD